MTRIFRMLVLVGVLPLLASCDAKFTRAFGLAPAAPPAPPTTIDILCDMKGGGTCTAERLAATAEQALTDVHGRPKSAVRVWSVGQSLTDCALVASVTVPEFPANRRASREAEARFLTSARTTLNAAAPRMADTLPRRRTALAETLTRVAWAGSGTPQRTIIALTDAREVSDVADFECGALPSEQQMLRRLGEMHALTPGSLAGVDVHFAYVTVERVERDRCAVTLARADAIRQLWIAALRRAGARSVSYATGAPELTKGGQS